MMIRIACFAILTIVGLQAQNNYYFPQIADGTTGSGGTLKTTLLVANTSPTVTAKITISATHDDSSPALLNISRDVEIGPGATRVFTTDGSGDGSFLAGRIVSDAAVSISGWISVFDGSGALISETIAPVLSSDQLAAQYLLAVDTTAPLNTALALYNPSSSVATIDIALRDTAGQSIASTSMALDGHLHTTLRVDGDLFPGLGSVKGSLVLTSSSGVKVAAAGLRRSAGALALFPVTSTLSHQVRFLFPQVSDGPGATGVAKTTWIVTNLSSSQPALPELNLTLDDGTEMVVNVNGLDGSSIAPGATVFWQSDGASASLTTGAAVITSDQPLAITAIAGTSDSNGTEVAESALVPSTLNSRFLIPFDSSNAAGAVLQNSGRRPINPVLTLLDQDGVQIATRQLDPVPGFGRRTGLIQDFFPDASLPAAGAVIVSTGTPADLSMAAYSLLLNAAMPAIRIPIAATGSPSTVTPTLAGTGAQADISTSGGTLSVTDGKGNKFTLTIPAGALLDRETIKMTPITKATGISGPGLVAGVQLEPDGIALLQPAQLRIDLAAPQPDGTFPIGWRGSAPGVYLNPPLPDPSSLTLVLTHFSGAGVGGFDLTSELTSIANQLDLVNSAAAYWAAQARQDSLLGDDESSAIDGEKLLETLDIGLDTVLVPMMELATASDDEDVMRCAVTLAIGAVRQLELLGVGDDPHATAAQDFINYALQRWTSKVKTRCDAHDFTAFYDAIGVLRQSALLGLNADIDPSSCPPVLQLSYTSEMLGDIPVGVTGSFDAKLSGNVTLRGNFTKDMLNQVTDPAKDLLTSFTLTGSGPESYDSIDFKVNNVPAGCSETISAKTPATMTVKAGSDPQVSQVQFQFSPHYDPQAVTANGQQLCSFCPVFRKTPVKVGIWMDPGKPSETLLSTCQGVSISTIMYSWWTSWVTNHAQAGDNGYIEGWDLVNTPTVFAQKTINASITGPGGIKLTEKDDLKLKPMPQ